MSYVSPDTACECREWHHQLLPCSGTICGFCGRLVERCGATDCPTCAPPEAHMLEENQLDAAEGIINAAVVCGLIVLILVVLWLLM